MAFVLVGGPAAVIEEFDVTDNTAIEYGECLKIASGKVLAAGDATDIACISVQAVDATTPGGKCKAIIPLPGQIFEAPYSGTPDASFLVGMMSADLDDNGTGVDAADVTGGKISILSINSTTGKVRCMIKGRAFC